MPSTTDIGNGDGQQLSTIEFPHLQSVEELDRHIETTYGPEVLTALRDSNKDQASMVEELHKYGLNGRSEAVEQMYRLHRQEFDRKETLLGTTWRWTKEAAGMAGNAIAAPFRWTYSSFKKHPILTTLGVAALVAGGFAGGYYLAGGWETFLATTGLDKVLAGAEAATELAPVVPDLPPLPGGGAYDIPAELPPL